MSPLRRAGLLGVRLVPHWAWSTCIVAAALFISEATVKTQPLGQPAEDVAFAVAAPTGSPVGGS
jgi:hypothetical protein